MRRCRSSAIYSSYQFGKNHAEITGGTAEMFVRGSSAVGGAIGYHDSAYEVSGVNWIQRADDTAGNCIGSIDGGPGQAECDIPIPPVP